LTNKRSLKYIKLIYILQTKNEYKVFRAIAKKNQNFPNLLLGGEMAVKELAPHFNASDIAASKNTFEGGLVKRRTAGLMRSYQGNPDALCEVHEWTSHYEKF
jgi:hypothetical protein